MTKVKRNFLIPLEGKSEEIRGIYDKEEIQLVFFRARYGVVLYP